MTVRNNSGERPDRLLAASVGAEWIGNVALLAQVSGMQRDAIADEIGGREPIDVGDFGFDATKVIDMSGAPLTAADVDAVIRGLERAPLLTVLTIAESPCQKCGGSGFHGRFPLGTRPCMTCLGWGWLSA